MCLKKYSLIGAVVLGLLALAGAASRPDYYTSGFYTRGANAAFYVDQGGELDPFYIPVQSWTVLPRVTLEAQGGHSSVAEDESMSLSLIPGVLFMYGRPEHNHLFVDASASLPLAESGSGADGLMDYVITLGGVKKTGKSQIYGRLGHRRLESTDAVLGDRVAEVDYTGDVGICQF
jgi:hypothetical protein